MVTHHVTPRVSPSLSLVSALSTTFIFCTQRKLQNNDSSRINVETTTLRVNNKEDNDETTTIRVCVIRKDARTAYCTT